MSENESVSSRSPSKPWSETRKGRIVVLAGVLGLFVPVFWMAMKSRQMMTPKPGLVVDEQRLNFGEVWEDPAFVWTLPIHNTTNTEIEIAGFETSCTCGKIEPPSLTVPAQATVGVRLTLNLLTPPSESDPAEKEFKVAIQPRIIKGLGSQVVWTVQGRVKRPFHIDPPVVDFQDSLVRGQTFAPRFATITYGQDVTQLSAGCDSSLLIANVTRDATNPRRFRLMLQPKSDAPSGPFSHRVRLKALTSHKEELPGVVSIIGQVLENISLTPNIFSFGAECIGTELHETIVVQSHNGDDFAIQTIDTGGAVDIRVEVGKQMKDRRQLLDLFYKVSGLGIQKRTIRVKVKSQNCFLDLSLLLYCHGVPAHNGGKIHE
jgi:hypothetical protein